MIQAGKIRVWEMITHRLGLAETGLGFQLVARAQDSLKVIIEPKRWLAPVCNSRDTIPIRPTTNQTLSPRNTSHIFRTWMCYRIPGGPLNLDCRKLAIVWSRGPCLDRLISSKKKYKQIPVNNNCVKCQSYHRNCIYESGPGIILNP